MKKKIWIGIAIIVPIILFTTIGVIQSQNTQAYDVETIQPLNEKMKYEIMVPGEIDLAEIEHVAIRVEDDYKLLVEEGEVVEEGTPLIEYKGDDIQFEKEQLAIQIESGYLRINQIGKQEDHVNKEQKKLEKDVGKKEARDHYRAEREQLDYEKRVANLDLRQLLNQKEQLEKQAEKLLEKSPLAGEVIKISEGMEGGITIASRDSFVVSGFLSEYDSLEIKEGQKVEITSDAIVDETWRGELTEIDFFPSQNEVEGTGIKYPFAVSVKEGDTTSLRPGYQVILQIVTDEREALTVPIAAVHQVDEVAYVYTVHNGIASQQQVELGMTSDGNYEIRSGLSEGDLVISDIPDGLRDGSDVNVVD